MAGRGWRCWIKQMEWRKCCYARTILQLFKLIYISFATKFQHSDLLTIKWWTQVVEDYSPAGTGGTHTDQFVYSDQDLRHSFIRLPFVNPITIPTMAGPPNTSTPEPESNDDDTSCQDLNKTARSVLWLFAQYDKLKIEDYSLWECIHNSVDWITRMKDPLTHPRSAYTRFCNTSIFYSPETWPCIVPKPSRGVYVELLGGIYGILLYL